MLFYDSMIPWLFAFCSQDAIDIICIYTIISLNIGKIF